MLKIKNLPTAPLDFGKLTLERQPNSATTMPDDIAIFLPKNPHIRHPFPLYNSGFAVVSAASGYAVDWNCSLKEAIHVAALCARYDHDNRRHWINNGRQMKAPHYIIVDQSTRKRLTVRQIISLRNQYK